MNNTKIKVVIWVVVVVSVVAAISFWIFNTKSKAAYVDTAKVFNSFTLKKNLEAEYKKVENLRKMQLDSMRLILSMIKNDNRIKDKLLILDYKTQEYERRFQEFEEANQALSDKYNEQIWNQLNQYIKDYGVKYDFDFIFGSEGNGNLMYAAEKNDITASVIEFVNKSYDGQ